MDGKYVGAAALAIIILVLAGGVIVARQNAPTAEVTAPGVRVETNEETGATSVQAPHANVEKNDGIRIQAPGVDINVPRQSAD